MPLDLNQRHKYLKYNDKPWMEDKYERLDRYRKQSKLKNKSSTSDNELSECEINMNETHDIEQTQTNLNHETTNIITINTAEFLDYTVLSAKDLKELINKFKLWMIQEGLGTSSIDDECNMDDEEEVNNCYCDIYNILKDPNMSPIEYYSSYDGIDVKNIIFE